MGNGRPVGKLRGRHHILFLGRDLEASCRCCSRAQTQACVRKGVATV